MTAHVSAELWGSVRQLFYAFHLVGTIVINVTDDKKIFFFNHFVISIREQCIISYAARYVCELKI